MPTKKTPLGILDETLDELDSAFEKITSEYIGNIRDHYDVMVIANKVDSLKSTMVAQSGTASELLLSYLGNRIKILEISINTFLKFIALQENYSQTTTAAHRHFSLYHRPVNVSSSADYL